MKRLSLIAASIFLITSAGADTVTTTWNGAVKPTEFSQSGSLDYFDASSGKVLTGAKLTVFGDITGSVSLTNDNTFVVNAKGTVNSALDFGSTWSVLNALLVDPIGTVNLSFNSGFHDIAAGGTSSFGPLGAQGSLTIDLFSILGQLQNAGVFNIGCVTNTGAGASGTGPVSAEFSASGKCGAEIVYTYDAGGNNNAPEPGSLALAGLALAGLSIGARRRKA